jgi:hypothetical protein
MQWEINAVRASTNGCCPLLDAAGLCVLDVPGPKLDQTRNSFSRSFLGTWAENIATPPSFAYSDA